MPSRASSASASSKRSEINRVSHGASAANSSKRSAAAGSRSMEISVPSAPIRSASRRAWPPPPKVQSTTTRPAAGSVEADQLGGEDWNVLGRHVGRVSPFAQLGPAPRGRATAGGEALGQLAASLLDLLGLVVPLRRRSRSRGDRRRRRCSEAPESPACSIRCLLSRMRPAESSSTSSEEPKKRRLDPARVALIGLSGAIQLAAPSPRPRPRARPRRTSRRPPSRRPRRRGRRAGTGRDRDPVLCVEAVLVLSAECHLREEVCGAGVAKSAGEKREGRGEEMGGTSTPRPW